MDNADNNPLRSLEQTHEAIISAQRYLMLPGIKKFQNSIFAAFSGQLAFDIRHLSHGYMQPFPIFANRQKHLD
jgi:hypothetical protein